LCNATGITPPPPMFYLVVYMCDDIIHAHKKQYKNIFLSHVITL
jgi:hypothetical protein